MGKLTPLRFRPGIVKDTTDYSNEGGWRDADLVRFRLGFPETIGGWAKENSGSTFLGTCRNLHLWSTLAGIRYLGVGTHLKYYIAYAGGYNDITPIRETTSAGDVTFAATNGSTQITVTDVNHGATADSFVTFSGAVSLGGAIIADVLNQEYQIDSVEDADTYYITAKDTSGAAVAANGSDTGNGGASVIGEYQISAGLDTTAIGVGWGSDPWGSGGWGEPGGGNVLIQNLRTWSHDNFGEDLVFSPRAGNVYYWNATGGLNARGVPLSSLAGADDAPTAATVVLVSDQDRHLICFGADTSDDPGVIDPLLIRWSDQENVADWAVRTTNTAGSIRLSSGSAILSAIQTKREVAILTDQSLYTMQYLGTPYTFGVQEVGSIGTLAGPNACVAVDDRIYWMEEGRFMQYDGRITELPCTVKEFVFDDWNANQRFKVISGHNPRYSEVWWFYPDGDENDRYVSFNYVENVWMIGSISRTAWLSSGLSPFPLAAATDGYLYSHEFGTDDGSTDPATPLNPYIESSAIDVEDGDDFLFGSRILPDLTFRNSTGTPSVTMTIKGREYPGGAFTQTDPETVSEIAVDQWTNQNFIRIRGRAFAIRVESNVLGCEWRLGTPRVEVRKDGKR